MIKLDTKLTEMTIGSKIIVSKKLKKTKTVKRAKPKQPKNLEDTNVDTGQFEDVTDEEILQNIPFG